MSFFKTTALASVSTATTMLCGLVTTKFLAMLIGPKGMALTGQFYSVTAIVTLFATVAITNGMIKYLAEKDDTAHRQRVVQTAYRLSGAATLAMALITTVGATLLSRNSFQSDEYQFVFVIYGLLLVFSIQNAMYSAILNGVGQIRKMTTLTITTSVLNMLAVVLFAHFMGVKGVLIAASISNVLIWILGFSFVRRYALAPKLNGTFDKKIARDLLGFSAMSLVMGLTLPLVQVAVRTRLMQIDLDTAGLWQATTRLSDYYLTFVNSVLMIYYLPKLSSITDKGELRREIGLGYARVIPAVLVITTTIWLLRYVIVQSILTKEFYAILPLLKLYLIGDVLKIASWILSFLMWAKAMKKLFITTELVFAALNVGLNYWFIDRYGLIGTGWAYIALYSLYLIMIVVLLRGYLLPGKLVVRTRQQVL